jgi:hypothetical protein
MGFYVLAFIVFLVTLVHLGQSQHHRRFKDGPSAKGHPVASLETLTQQERANLDSVLLKMGERRLNKTVFNSKQRVLFFVGMEGSGHHMMRALLEKCAEVANGLCRPDAQLANILFSAEFVDKGKGNSRRYTGLFGAETYALHGKSMLDVYDKFRKYAVEASSSLATKTETERRLIYLNTGGPTEGMLSYPNHAGPYRELHSPDMHVIAAIAEATGLDLRIVVLQRSALEMWRSLQSRWYVFCSMFFLLFLFTVSMSLLSIYYCLPATL